VFRVRPAQVQTPPLASPTPTEPASPPTPTPASPVRAGSTLSDQSASIDRTKLVLIADSDIEAGKRLAGSVASWGLHPILVHDGVEAMLMIQRMLPATVVLDAALPKMFGFQICEVIKRNESLRDTHVVLIDAVHDRDRYRRPPTEIYGADVYVERSDLSASLIPALRRFGLAVAAPPPPAVQPALAVPVTPEVVPVAGAPQAASPTVDGLDDERAKAERLARIIVSDIVLYNSAEFEAAVDAGNVLVALGGVLEEGRALFRQRIDERVRAGRSYIEQELLRVAAERAAR
jgi:CheY-like chemotaxis protein